jgi:GT2 family glycosyltransferase
MNTLLVAIPVSSGDVDVVLANLKRMAEMDGQVDHHALLFLDFTIKQVLFELKDAFRHWFVRVVPSTGGGWPRQNNERWQDAARHLERNPKKDCAGWLYLEPESMPLRKGWLDEIADEYIKARKPFMGNVSENRLSTCAVYPFDISNHCTNALLVKSQPYNYVLAQEVGKSRIHHTDLIAVHPVMYNKSGVGPSGLAHPDDVEKLIKRFPKAVIYQGVSPKSERTKSQTSHVGTVAPLYTISVLCLNHSDLTKKCLDSIIAHSDNYELYVTNNGSTDDTEDMLRDYEAKYGIKVITNKENKGFQEPNEHVLTLARGRYFVLFNNDMEACEGWLDGLRHPFDTNPRMALTGIAGTCCAINGEFKGVQGDDTKPEYIEGGCLMAPSALLRKHGMFSPYLKFIYWEDTDLGLRMREMGYEIATVPLDINHNHRSATTKSLDLKGVREHNHKAMIERWGFYLKRRNFERRVQIKRRGARGDVLLLTPALDAIRKKWPQAKINVVTAHPDMLRGLANVTAGSLAEGDYDYAFDLDFAYEKRPGVPIVEVFAESCGVKLESHRPIMTATLSDLAWAETVARGRRVALIHAGPTTWPGKNWPVDRWEKVVEFLKLNDFFTIAVGAENSPHCGCDDSVAGLTTPQQLYALCMNSKLFCGLDSMCQHVASAADTPSVVLFGATEPKDIQRKAPHLLAVQASRKQADCVGEHGRRKGPVLDAPCDGSCMAALTTTHVQKAIAKLI